MSKIETCIQCDQPTGRAGRGEDSLYDDETDVGPFCEECWEAHESERGPAPTVIGTPEGNAATIAKLNELAVQFGMVFVPDPEKIARAGGLPAPADPDTYAADCSAALTRLARMAAGDKAEGWSLAEAEAAIAARLAVTDVREALEAARAAIATEARRYASFYPPGSDGSNTLVMLSEWVERRAAVQEAGDG